MGRNLLKCFCILERSLLPCFPLYGNIFWTFCVPPLFITVICNLCVWWSSWYVVLFTILMGYSFIPVNTAFRCSISWCNNIVVEQTVLAHLTRFFSVPIFHLSGACAFQLIYNKPVLVSFLWTHVSIWSPTVLLTSTSRDVICMFFSNLTVN